MTRHYLRNMAAIAAAFTILSACSSERTPEMPRTAEPKLDKPAATPAEQLSYTVVRILPHDIDAFTQGLVVDNGTFLESTGQTGKSTLRRVEIATGKTLRSIRLDDAEFGEGMTVIGNEAYVLTWLNQRGYVYDVHTLKLKRTFSYNGEGWGLTTNGTELFMSNGTNIISVHDPDTYRVIRSIAVTYNGRPLRELNELEWIDGFVWANVWRSDLIVRIDPSTGVVTGVADLTGLLPYDKYTPSTDVLNGIAWDSSAKALYVTGKNWPTVYQIDLRAK